MMQHAEPCGPTARSGCHCGIWGCWVLESMGHDMPARGLSWLVVPGFHVPCTPARGLISGRDEGTSESTEQSRSWALSAGSGRRVPSDPDVEYGAGGGMRPVCWPFFAATWLASIRPPASASLGVALAVPLRGTPLLPLLTLTLLLVMLLYWMVMPVPKLSPPPPPEDRLMVVWLLSDSIRRSKSRILSSSWRWTSVLVLAPKFSGSKDG
mmetsp:Transcript_18139/g.32259  ORF Transcript_18139/g.32259 Transcript_18139/m.32259 type:complete len:210 (+) Transcript_18139:287-916(+)